jgi:hypothetical protein
MDAEFEKMSSEAEIEFHTDPAFAPLLQEMGINENSVFTDPRIKVWRSLPDRENASMDYVCNDGSSLRLHIKRYPPMAGFMARHEVKGFNLLKEAGVPSANIIAHGHRQDRSSFIILEDLADYMPADKWLAGGGSFDRLLNATADLAALLHNKGLHHRDLYLCHFMVKPVGDSVDAKLIDMTRVDRLRSVLTRRRWIIKDLAQFWYSTQNVPVSDEQRIAWLARYCKQRAIKFERFIGPIQQKAAAIARHDVKLRKKQPGRNVSIDDERKTESSV